MATLRDIAPHRLAHFAEKNIINFSDAGLTEKSHYRDRAWPISCGGHICCASHHDKQPLITWLVAIVFFKIGRPASVFFYLVRLKVQYILMVTIFMKLGGPVLTMQDFTSEKACLAVAAQVKNEIPDANVKCLPK